MAERNVKVKLTAQVQEYMRGMEAASKATREVGSEAERMAQIRDAFQEVGRAASLMGAVAAVGVGLAVSKFADFDAAMSNVQAATGESEESMKRLSNAALDAGARTVFSAEEAANAIEELSKAGVSTADILSGGLDGALDLAAAGGLGVADAAGIAATALKTFKLEGEDMSHVADLLAAGAGKAMGDVTDLSAALNQSAMVANATGLSIEETTAGLAAFASQGLLGSDAGTSFKTMLMSLSGPTGKAKEEMDRLGISAFDASGNFIGLAEFAGSLEKALAGMSKEQQQATLKTIFGADAIRAATVLYSEGKRGISDWVSAVNDQGYAAEQAATRLDNLKGDIEALGGALDTALIKTGESGNDTLRDMVQWLTQVVDAYNMLPAPMQSAAMGIGVITAGIGLAAGAASIAVPQFVTLMGAVNTLGITSMTASQALAGITGFLTGPWGAALMGAAAVTTVLVGEKVKLLANASELADTLDRESGAITENSTAWAANKLQKEGVLGAAKRLGVDADVMTQAWLGNAEALKTVNDRLNRFKTDSEFRMNNTDWEGWSDDLADVGYALDGSNQMLAEAKTRHDELREATEGAASATETQEGALDGLGGTASSVATQIDELANTIRGLGSEQFDLREANRQLEKSYDDFSSAIERNGFTLDTSTEQGRAVEASIDSMAQATLNAAAALAVQSGDQDAANAKLEEGRQALIDILAPYYGSRDAAAAYVAQLGLITPEKLTKVIADTSPAQAAIDEFIRANSSKRINIAVGAGGQGGLVVGSAVGNMFEYANGGISEHAAGFHSQTFADGGVTSGIYSGGTPLYKFAEPETGWEAFISGKQGQEQRNRGIWIDSGARLGMDTAIGKAIHSAVTDALSGGKFGMTVNQTINAAPGSDERLLARRVLREISREL